MKDLPKNYEIRKARLQDLPSLIELEHTCFDTDRLEKSSFRHFIKTSHSSKLLVLLNQKKIIGHLILFFHRGTKLSRLYSIALHPKYQGKGLGSLLMDKAEELCRENGKLSIRLEVKKSNLGAIALYKKLGYRTFKIKKAYYQDHQDALCMEKRILPLKMGLERSLPYYAQSTNFTCGPACLIMALKYHYPKAITDIRLELEIWREATTIFMTSGHGGCGPRGLAYAAYQRGLVPKIYTNKEQALFLDGLRNPEKRKILEIVHQDFEEKIKNAHIKMRLRVYNHLDIEKALKRKAIPLVLISSYKLLGTKGPHWVAVAGYDEEHFYIHDPDYEAEAHKELSDFSFIPVEKKEFLKMCRYGKSKAMAMVTIAQSASIND